MSGIREDMNIGIGIQWQQAGTGRRVEGSVIFGSKDEGLAMPSL